MARELDHTDFISRFGEGYPVPVPREFRSVQVKEWLDEHPNCEYYIDFVDHRVVFSEDADAIAFSVLVG